MAEAHAKHHDYHLVDPSPWPIIGAVSAFVLALAAIFAMHGQVSWWWVTPGVIGVLYTMFGWWVDVIKEAHRGDHTRVVQLHLRYGMIMFIASEVMFFVAWFWAWFEQWIYAGVRLPEVATAWTQWPPVKVALATCTALSADRLESKKAQNQATKNITSEAMNRIMP